MNSDMKKKSKLQIKTELEKRIEYVVNKAKEVEEPISNRYVFAWNVWQRHKEAAETKLFQLKEDVKEELAFLKKLRKILHEYRSEIPETEIGRQNVLNDIDNELNLDKRIKEFKEILKE